MNATEPEPTGFSFAQKMAITVAASALLWGLVIWLLLG